MGLEVVGTWRLEKFEIEETQGFRRPWGQGSHGTLIYSPSGYMSVSINRTIEAKADVSAQNTIDSILFYAGTFTTEGSKIIHQVTEASDPNRIGKSLIRYAELSDHTLKLRSPIESFGTAHLQWKRI
jgi:hypothetical protein